MIRPLPVTSDDNADAVGYVATTPEEGLAQLEVLKSIGCLPTHRVLEIGCGALIAGYPVMQYLDEGNYWGVDPNVWLRMASRRIPEVAQTIAIKRPHLQTREDFRANLTENKFDFIFSHSILSHCSYAQLKAFLVAAKEQLAPDGKLVASIRLAEGNPFGSPGSQVHGEVFKEWQYPGVSWFTENDVMRLADEAGLFGSTAPGLTRIITKANPKAVHDWIFAVQKSKAQLDREAQRRTESRIAPVSLPISKPSVTFVTAFFRLRDRKVDEEELLQNFRELAASGLPITLFADEGFAEDVPDFPSNVHVIERQLGQLWPFRHHPAGLPEHRDPQKDTKDFLLLQHAKLDLLAAAAKDDAEHPPVNFPSHYAWIDFGILKIVKDHAAFLTKLKTLAPPPKCVLAPGCWRKGDHANDDGVNWRFCGGFLLADRGSIPDLVEDYHVTFRRQKHLTWEVNTWAQMEAAGTLFDWYEADHNDSIIYIEKAECMRRKYLEALKSDAALITPRAPRVCLNMIVKNEAKIILRCLTAALPFIDTWVIADTGSTDGTPDLITNFFKEHNIPGRLCKTEFQNFSQARNAALTFARAAPGWDYVLFLDADMELTGNAFDRSQLTAGSYNVEQRTPFRSWWNTRLLARSTKAHYEAPTHEYVSIDGPPPEQLRTLVIEDRDDGGSKGNKAERDIRLLSEDLAKNPNSVRSMFYLAQTYRETGRPAEALPWYKRRVEIGGWDEETYFSLYGICLCHKDLGNTAEFVLAALEAYNFRPSRGESLRELACYFRDRAKNEIAFMFDEELARLPFPGDFLFVDRESYDWVADKGMSISGFYATPRRREMGYRACAKLTTHANDGVREEARRNFTHYAKSAAELFGATTQEIDWRPTDGWHPMNPSVYVSAPEIGIGITDRFVLVRTVNYTVTREGQYPTVDNSNIIKTKNYIIEFDKRWNVVKSTLIKDKTDLPRSSFPVEGFEDCRLWHSPEFGLIISATVRDLADNPNGNCEMVIADLDEDFEISTLTPIRDRGPTEKNWMPIVGWPRHFIYLCDPTIRIAHDGEKTAELSRQPAPVCLKDLRGGSQVIPHDDGWLCLTHEVAWRPERVYLHRFVKFTKDFHVEAISDPFYFQHVGIEFCAGLARDGERLVASYGVNDASAHLAFFDPARVNAQLRKP